MRNSVASLHHSPITLHSHLTLLVLAAVLPVFLLSAFMFWRDVQLQREAVEQGMRETAQALSLAVDREIGTAKTILEALSASAYLDARDFGAFYRLCISIAERTKGSRIILFDRSGQQIINTAFAFGAPLPNPLRDSDPRKPDSYYPELTLGGPDSVKAVLATARSFVSDLFVALSTKKPNVVISVPVQRNDQLFYVLEMSFDPTMLTDLLREQNFSSGWYSTIIDRRGIIIARTVNPERFVGHRATPQQIARITKSDEGWDSRVNLEGAAVDYAFSRSKLTGWTINVAAPQSILYAPLHRSIRTLALGAILLLFFAIGIALVLARRISRPIMSLASSAEAIQRGEPVDFKGSYVREISRLRESLINAGAAARAALEERERRLIAEAKQKEAEAAKQHVANILESMSDGFCAFDAEWRFTYINKKAEQELARQNFKRADLLGKVLWEVFPSQTGTRWHDAVQQAMQKRVPISCEFYYPPLGEWYEDRVSPTPDGSVGIYRRNITEHKRAECFHLLQIATSQALAESDDIASATPKILQAICELTRWEVGAIWAVDQSTGELKPVKIWHVPAVTVREFEAAYKRIRFAPRMGLVGRVWASGEAAWISDISQDSNFLRAREAINEGMHAGVCFPIKAGPNVLGAVECFSREVREADDECLQTLANIGPQIGQFIERRRAEDALRLSELRFSGVINSAMDAIVVVNQRQRIVLFNPGAEAMFGWTSSEAVGKSLDQLIPPQFREAHCAHIENFAKTGVTNRRMGALGALSALRTNGEEFPIEASISQLELGGEKLFTVILRDITKRKRAEHALAEQAHLLDLSYDAIFVLDEQRRIIYWNKGAEEDYGYTADEALGKVAHELLETKFPEPLEQIGEKLSRDGRWSGELIQKRKNGSNMVVATRWSLDRDQQQKPLSTLEINRDITERKKLEAQILQVQKMESLGTLAGGVAHDFNNILNIIQAYASVLSEHGARREDVSKNVTVINDTVKRGAVLVRQLLTMARKSEGLELEPINLNHLIQAVLPLVRETFPKTIDLSCSLEPNLPPIMGDKNQIEQALLNLALNARDAMPRGGRLAFKTQFLDGAALQPLGDPEQRYACIEVNDTGIGIDDKIRERIFEPFFTTKAKGQGTGLGLSMVYGIAKSHNGFVDVESRPMAGTSFRLYFPIIPITVAAKEPMIEADVETMATSNGTGTVLIAEDEANMLQLLEKIFLSRGYKVLTVSDGQAALDIYRRHKEEIAVVLLDLGLPKLSGRDVLVEIRRDNSDVKIILTSGYIDPATKIEIDSLQVMLLPKPYTPRDLFKTLHSLPQTPPRLNHESAL
jgi:PAS domain S-box-containing protein